MPTLETLHDLMVHQLKDLYSAERQLVQALPKMARQATSEALRGAISRHLGETKEHAARLEECLESLSESTRGPKCKGMEGAIAEGKELLEVNTDAEVLDVGIIATIQRMEHYEIAAYGTVCEYARVMGHAYVLQLMQKSLDEEVAADEVLSHLAATGIHALARRDGQEGMGAVDAVVAIERDETEDDEARMETDGGALKVVARAKSNRARAGVAPGSSARAPGSGSRAVVGGRRR